MLQTKLGMNKKKQQGLQFLTIKCFDDYYFLKINSNLDDITEQNFNDIKFLICQLNNKCIYLVLNNKQFRFIDNFKDFGFLFHHCRANYIMLVKLQNSQFILNTYHTLDKFNLEYFTHTVGVGGFVIRRDTNEILLVQEKNQLYYHFPGGRVDLYESIVQAAMREVYEETGVKTKFEGIFCIRENTNFVPSNNYYKFITSIPDIYFVCILEPLNININFDSFELSDAKWFKIDQFKEILTTFKVSKIFELFYNILINEESQQYLLDQNYNRNKLIQFFSEIKHDFNKIHLKNKIIDYSQVKQLLGKEQRQDTNSVKILNHKSDPTYQNVIIDNSVGIIEDKNYFISCLIYSIQCWKQQGCRGIYFLLRYECICLLEQIQQIGFTKHHTEEDGIMTILWINQEVECKIPNFPNHIVYMIILLRKSNKFRLFTLNGLYKLQCNRKLSIEQNIQYYLQFQTNQNYLIGINENISQEPNKFLQTELSFYFLCDIEENLLNTTKFKELTQLKQKYQQDKDIANMLDIIEKDSNNEIVVFNINKKIEDSKFFNEYNIILPKFLLKNV